MCGLFGAIGRYNPGTIRALALVNRDRGTDSLGFFNPKGSIKRAGDPLDCLADDDFSSFIEQRGWFIAGHTRAATHGVISDANAHPFKYGRIIGAHNGIVSAPKQYAVDSEYLIDKLQGGYQALADVSGYWGLSWFDGEDFYLQACGNEIAVGRVKGCWYYSSDWTHLDAAVHPTTDFLILCKGATISWNIKSRKYRVHPRLKIKSKRKATAKGAPEYRDYWAEKEAELWPDEWDWRDDWSEYTREYE